MSAPFDWPALLRAGLQTLRLRPAEFWALTPAELSLMLGLDHCPLPMGRARFRELAARHPDQGPTP
ncbi:rcc01693 family protein [Rubellimicrobium roseum]|uniref:Phage tail assembly chaperone n=1 Tax=Rubellimicrobium roseum TaxID=687525 RepID=A0A5C4NFI3_9RHOB|nr:rcc01693 family protein [Rubellimicrobium roseum]TNC73403.1 phage tail assembly chaperone [Rubellimicrobium roseum]